MEYLDPTIPEKKTKKKDKDVLRFKIESSIANVEQQQKIFLEERLSKIIWLQS